VFKITRDGTVTTLYSFCSQSACMDGAEPFTGLLQASDGNLYGTTTYAAQPQQIHEYLTHYRRGLQGMLRPFVVQIRFGDSAYLLVDQQS
jgi:hypothetical protein